MSDFGHNVKQVANGLSTKWLLEPLEQVRRYAQTVDDRLAGGDDTWSIALFPELFEATGNMLRLWCQLDIPGDFFSSELPKTITQLIEYCWMSAKGTIKPLVGRKFTLESQESIERASGSAETDRLALDGRSLSARHCGGRPHAAMG